MEDEQIMIHSLPIHEVTIEDNVVHLSPIGFDDGTKDPTDIKQCIIISEGYSKFLCISDTFLYRSRLVVVEYLHLDIWLLAHFSQDPKLISALNRSNGDPFKAIVAATQNIPDHQMGDVWHTIKDEHHFVSIDSGFLCFIFPSISHWTSLWSGDSIECTSSQCQ